MPERLEPIGVLVDELDGEYQIAVVGGAVDADREAGVNVVVFAGGVLGSPVHFGEQHDVVYDLAASEGVDGLVILFHFLPLAIRYDGTAGAPGPGYQVHVGPMDSDARGSVTLKTTDPHDHPALRFNYLSTDQDRREWVEAVRVARHILNQPAMDPYNGGETSPGVSVETADQIRDWVAWDAETALHPSCTARMGVDGGSVVDPLTLRVHGLDGLRVVDASAMPYVTNANIYAPVMMLAERKPI